ETNPNQLASKQFFFVRNPRGDSYSAESFAATVVTDGYALFGAENTGYDWAILKLDYPIGKEVGYFGFENSGGVKLAAAKGNRTDPFILSSAPNPYADLCRDTRSPWTDFNALAEGKDPRWFVNPYDLVAPPMLCASGYPGDLGNFNQV